MAKQKTLYQDFQTDSPIALIRIARGLTQAKLARACAISPAKLSSLELGLTSASGALLGKLAGALDCPPAALEGSDFSIFVRANKVSIEEVTDAAAR